MAFVRFRVASTRLARLRGVLAACAVAWSCIFTTRAAADPRRADEAFTEGVLLFQQKDYAAADAAFARSWAQERTERALWNLALCDARVGRFFEALGHYREYATLPDAKKDRLFYVDALIQKMRERVGHLVIHVPLGGLAVLVDGVEVGTSPLDTPVDVDPDKAHVVVAKAATIMLREEVPAPGPNVVTVQVERLDADFFFPRHPAPLVAPSSTASTHALPSRADRPPPSGSYVARNLIVAGTTGLAVAALTFGIAFSVTAQGEGAPAQANDDNLAAGFYIGAGGLVAAAAVTFLAWPKTSARRSAWLAPAISRDRMGLTLVGEF